MNKTSEEKIKEFWERNAIYENAKKRGAGKKKFYFLDGPPYATGYIHLGTALNKILKDMYIRFWRSSGFDVWDQPGYDTHGLPIENKVEKDMGIRNKSEIEKLGIERFIISCREFATRYIDVMSHQFADLGVWMDWKSPYLTLSNEYIEGAWATFKIGFEKGFLYRGLYPVHVCPHCETAVAYNEIEYKKVTDPSIFVKFHVKDNESLLIWTTTPWTLPSNTGIMANPKAQYVRVKVGNEILILAEQLVHVVMEKAGIKDYEIIGSMKGESLAGIKYSHPLSDIFQFQNQLKNAHRVILSEQFVSLADGTGLVHTAPGHGKEDYKVGVENGLPAISPVKLDGRYDGSCGKYTGMFVKDADRAIIDELRERGVLFFEDTITHDYPQCWRCKSLLVLISIPQWFFRITGIQNELIEENNKVNWQPQWGGQRFHNWLESLGDWPISRQRYWGIPLPIWTCEKCERVKIIGSADELPKQPADLHRPYIDEVEIECECGSVMKRIPDVLDVWFDSGLASWASLGYPNKMELFKRWWPADLNIEGSDQIRGWWNSEIITSIITFGKAPFKNILMHGMILDVHGKKMSKSLGNIVTPEEIIDKYGRDVLRYYLLSGPPWDDFYFNWTDVGNISKNLVIIENTFNFVKSYVTEVKKPAKLNVEDRWILSRLNSVTESYLNNFKSYNAHKAVTELHDFLLNDFSRLYIKLIRDRVWPAYAGEDKQAAFHTLYEVASQSAKLLAPICPFLAEQVYQDVLKPLEAKEESVHLEDLPNADEKLIDQELEGHMKLARNIIEAANALRQENKIKLRWPLASIVIDCEDEKLVTQLGSILQNICNVKSVKHGTADFPSKEFDGGKVYLDTNLTEELIKESLFREVLRKVQDMRKKSGLVISDRINLHMDCTDLKRFEKEIKKEVGAEKIVFAPVKGSKEELTFEDKKISISIEKI